MKMVTIITEGTTRKPRQADTGLVFLLGGLPVLEVSGTPALSGALPAGSFSLFFKNGVGALQPPAGYRLLKKREENKK